MAFLKSRRGAVVVTVLVILFSVVFGAHRSDQSRSDALEVFETGAYGDGPFRQRGPGGPRATCANLYTVASRYLPADNANLTDLKSNLDALSADVTDPFAQADLAVVAELVLNTLADEALSRAGRQICLRLHRRAPVPDPEHRQGPLQRPGSGL